MYSLVRFRYSSERKKALCHQRQSAKLRDLIASYFIQEGYKQAALALETEAKAGRGAPGGTATASSENPVAGPERNDANAAAQSLKLPGFSSIDKRKRIKFLILKGDILQAVRVMSVYYPTILDENKLLLFRLLRLNLIKMIRDHKLGKGPKTEEAERAFLDSVLRFVRENLLGKITASTELFRDLEITMSLLCFEFDPSKPASELLELPEKTRNLFNLSLRNECYRAVNQVILDSENPTSGSSTQRIYYKGIPFVDFDSAMLESLPKADPLALLHPAFDVDTIPGYHDVINFKDNTRGSLEDIVSFAPPSDEPMADANAESSASNESGLRLSRLEEICRLWVATELMLASRDPLGKKALFNDCKMQL